MNYNKQIIAGWVLCGSANFMSGYLFGWKGLLCTIIAEAGIMLMDYVDIQNAYIQGKKDESEKCQKALIDNFKQ